MDEFMNSALDEARAGAAEGGIPIGAALVDGNRLVATGRNRRLQDSGLLRSHPEGHGAVRSSREIPP